MASDGPGDGAAAEDSILPMNLVHLDYPTQEDAQSLEVLYQTAAQTSWVLRLGDAPDVHQATDLTTALEHGAQGRWTRGLLVQVRVGPTLNVLKNTSTAVSLTVLCIQRML
jgi:hypothetical protein